MKAIKKSRDQEAGKGKKKSKKHSLLHSAIIGASTPSMGDASHRPGEKGWVYD